MTYEREPRQDTDPLDIERIVTELRDKLPEIARDIIFEYSKKPGPSDSSDQNPSGEKAGATSEGKDLRKTADPADQAFFDNPDDPKEHSPRWHKSGVLTHSELFRQFMENGAPALMKEWGLSDKTSRVLSEKIDGTSKADLLQIVSLVHDLGKFTARTFETKNGVTTARFNGHEAHSGEIIRTTFRGDLEDLGLTESQIDYVADCAKLHFELGKIRQIAVESPSGNGYTMKYATSAEFRITAQAIIDEYPTLALEIGLMFIADSLSKSDVIAKPGTDEEIYAQEEELLKELAEGGYSPRLIEQALQQPVNMEIARQYLLVWAARPENQS